MAAARAAYIAGFTATSNLEAGRRYGVPTAGTAAHAFTLLHDTEAAAFRSQIEALGVGTTLLVDTYDITKGIATAVKVAGPELGAVRIDSGDLGVLTRAARRQLDGLGNQHTRIVLSGDLDEYAIAALRSEPVDVYGVGTSVVTGSGAPTAEHGLQAGRGGRPTGGQAQREQAVLRRREVGAAPAPGDRHGDRGGRVPGRRASDGRALRQGAAATAGPWPASRCRTCRRLEDARDLLAKALVSLPWAGLKLSRGDAAIPTTNLVP